MLTLGSMFAGIGGLELGFESTGRFETKWQVEIDDYANQVLSKHWPSVARWKDVKTFPPRPLADWQCDVIAGGFPCQDLSVAGKGAGLVGERSGLFREIIRVASIIKPRAIVLENVAALYARGLDVVLGELAQIGYDAEWHCVSAASVGAPHRRDRVFIIGYLAHSISTRAGNKDRTTRRQKRKATNALKPATLRQGNGQNLPKGTDASSADCGTLADSDNEQCKGCEQETLLRQSRLSGEFGRSCKNGRTQWATEPAVGRVADGVPKRMDRLRCLGNAIVPQVAEVVAERLLEILDDQDPKPTV